MTVVNYSDGTGNVTAITYDGDGQRTAMTDPTGTSTWSYDSLHRLTLSKDGAGNAVGYGYDLRGSLTSITYPDGSAVTRGYDIAGRLTSGEGLAWQHHQLHAQPGFIHHRARLPQRGDGDDDPRSRRSTDGDR